MFTDKIDLRIFREHHDRESSDVDIRAFIAKSLVRSSPANQDRLLFTDVTLPNRYQVLAPLIGPIRCEHRLITFGFPAFLGCSEFERTSFLSGSNWPRSIEDLTASEPKALAAVTMIQDAIHACHLLYVFSIDHYILFSSLGAERINLIRRPAVISLGSSLNEADILLIDHTGDSSLISTVQRSLLARSASLRCESTIDTDPHTPRRAAKAGIHVHVGRHVPFKNAFRVVDSYALRKPVIALEVESKPVDHRIELESRVENLRSGIIAHSLIEIVEAVERLTNDIATCDVFRRNGDRLVDRLNREIESELKVFKL